MQPQIEISPNLIKEMICEKANHKSRQIQFICKLTDCPNRFLCAQCILDHQKHLTYISLIDDFVEELEQKSKQKPSESEQVILNKIKQFIETNEFKPELQKKLKIFQQALNIQFGEIKQKFEKSKGNIQEKLEKNKELFIALYKKTVKELGEAINQNQGLQPQQSSSGNNEIEQIEIAQTDQLEEYLIQKASNQGKEEIQQTSTLLEQFYTLQYLGTANYDFGQIVNRDRVASILDEWKNIFQFNFDKNSWEAFAALQKLPEDKTQINWKQLSCQKTINSENKKPIYKILYLQQTNQIAVATEDFIISIYNANSCELQNTLEGHSQKILCLIELENGYIASGSQDKKILIWNIFTGNKEVILSGSENIVSCLISLPDQQLLSAGSDKMIRLWDIKNPGKLIKSVPENNSFVQGRCLCMELGCGELFVGTEHSINVLKYPELELITCLKGHTGPVKNLSLIPQYLVSAADDKSLKIWNILDKSCIQTLTFHTGIIQKVCGISNEIIISAGDDGRIIVWTKSEEETWANYQKNVIEKAHEGPIYDFTLSSSKMFTVGKDSKINFWQ